MFTRRQIDYSFGDSGAGSSANLLNEKKMATIIRLEGFRLWGNRTASSDPKWQFLSVVRTADAIDEAILRSHLWAIDRNIAKTYLDDVSEGVNAYLRDLVARGAILGGSCRPDPQRNTVENIAAGRVYFDIEFTPAYPAERITFTSRLRNDHLATLVND